MSYVLCKQEKHVLDLDHEGYIVEMREFVGCSEYVSKDKS